MGETTEQAALRAPAGLAGRPWLSLVLLALLLAVRFVDPAGVERVRLTFFDFLQSIMPRPALAGAVVIVDIDEASLGAIGQWPWPRNKLAELTSAIAALEPAVIGFDVLFPERDRLSPTELARTLPGIGGAARDQLMRLPSHDALLARSFAGAPVVLAVAAGPGPAVDAGTSVGAVVASDFPSAQSHLTRFGRLISNIPELDAAAAGRGTVTLAPDVDGVVRRIPAAVAVGEQIFPSLTVEMARVALGSQAIVLDSGAFWTDGLRIADRALPTDGTGHLWIHYAQPGMQQILSAADVLARRIDTAAIAGKLVLVGTTAAGVADYVTTPFGDRLSDLELHAQLLDGMLSSDLLRRPGYMMSVELLALLVVGLAVIGAVRRLPGWRLLPFVGGLLALVFGFALLVYWRERLLLDATFPALGAILLYMGAVTEGVLTEERARRRTEEQLRRALLRAESASKAKSDFLANMSHELRTPLTAILGFSETIKSGVFGPIAPSKYADYVNEIHASGNHLLAIVSDVLDMSRIEAGEAKLEESDVDLREAVDECLRMLNPRSEKKRMQMERHIASDLPHLRADRRMVKQMFINLLANAVTFTPEGGTVAVSAVAGSDRRIVIAVRDTGIGIARAELARVMEPFHTVERPLARSYQGVGLGLPLTRSLAELHGGTLLLESKPGVGTVATLAFPAVRTLSPRA